MEQYKVREGYPRVDCTEAWAKHCRLNRISWIMFAAWIPYGMVGGLAFYKFFPNANSNLVFVWVIPYVITLIVVGNMVSRFRCPKCGYRFYAFGPFGLGHNGFARKCRNCGLRKWQCPGSETPSP
ncbi:MAG TPA: hypothetical protein VN612_17630 [Acidobacteriaceae bacterium]|nr:hypothetical protein [Acidobacteriaceae bacterium]